MRKTSPSILKILSASAIHTDSSPGDGRLLDPCYLEDPAHELSGVKGNGGLEGCGARTRVRDGMAMAR